MKDTGLGFANGSVSHSKFFRNVIGSLTVDGCAPKSDPSASLKFQLHARNHRTQIIPLVGSHRLTGYRLMQPLLPFARDLIQHALVQSTTYRIDAALLATKVISRLILCDGAQPTPERVALLVVVKAIDGP